MAGMGVKRMRQVPWIFSMDILDNPRCVLLAEFPFPINDKSFMMNDVSSLSDSYVSSAATTKTHLSNFIATTGDSAALHNWEDGVQR